MQASSKVLPIPNSAIDRFSQAVFQYCFSLGVCAPLLLNNPCLIHQALCEFDLVAQLFVNVLAAVKKVKGLIELVPLFVEQCLISERSRSPAAVADRAADSYLILMKSQCGCG